MSKESNLRVGVHDYRPLAYKQNDRWVGLEVEIWERIADSLDLTYQYVEQPVFSDLLLQTADGDLDISLAGITRTSERAKDLRMSFFTLDTGLGIAVKPASSFSIKDLLKSLFSKQTLVLLGLLVLFSILAANVYWLIEGGHSVSETFRVGILESFWWSIVTFSTVGYGDIYPATYLGKFFGIVAILSGLAIFGLYIGQLSASLALVKISSKINSVDDLAQKKVGVKRGTTAVALVKSKHAQVIEFDTVEDIFAEVGKGTLDAVVADMPVLQDLAKESGLVVVGQAFSRQAYSYIFPKKAKNTKLIQKINQEIVKIRESGEYDDIYSKYLIDS